MGLGRRHVAGLLKSVGVVYSVETRTHLQYLCPPSSTLSGPGCLVLSASGFPQGEPELGTPGNHCKWESASLFPL